MAKDYSARFLIILFFIGCFYGCNTKNEIDATLNYVETIIETSPEEALDSLRSIKRDNLDGKRQKAHYALLKSMALDKNYIDLKTFDTLQPAIDYYLSKGSPDEKLRTYFYKGRISQNRGELTDASKSFKLGGDLSAEVSDSATLGRLFHSQGNIYNSFFNNKSAGQYQAHAADIFFKSGNLPSYNLSILDALSNYISEGCKEEAESIFNNLDYSSFISDSDKSQLYSTTLAYYTKFLTKDSVNHFIDNLGFPDYLCDHNKLGIVHKLVLNNLQEKGAELFSTINIDSDEIDSIRYYAVKLQLYEALGDYEEAFHALYEYSRMAENEDYELLQQHTAVTEENHQHELNLIKSQNRQRLLKVLIGLSVVILLLGIALATYIVRSINQKRKIADEKANVAKLESERLLMENKIKELEAKQLKEEIARINDLMMSLTEDKSRLEEMVKSRQAIPEEVARQIRSRISLLNALFYDYINENEAQSDHSDKMMAETIGDIDEFLNATRLSYMVAYPKFIRHLEEHGMTEDEINYLCLYAIGLNGRQITNYMKSRSHVNLSSSLRKKLGLTTHDTNIALYIRKLIEECGD